MGSFIENLSLKKDGDWIYLTVNEKFNELTCKEFLQLFHLSKKTIYELFQNEYVKRNDEIVYHHTILNKDDVLKIKIFYDEEIDFLPEDIPLKIIYEDDIFLIINKPPFMIVHPDSKDGKHTLCNAVANYYQKTNQKHSVRYLHRLDKDTSGLIIFCKCSFFQPLLDDMLSKKAIRRNYYAICEGKCDIKGKIEKPIGRNRHDAKKHIVSKNGKYALTYFETLAVMNKMSLVKLQLETGRTHQIRVHLASIGHPIVSDPLYGHKHKEYSRLCLHAYEVVLYHPLLQKTISVKCSLPDDFKEFKKKSNV